MNSHPSFIIGIDIAAESFVGSLFQPATQSVSAPQTWTNTEDGFHACEQWIKQHNLTSSTVLVCLENTGAYSEALCYWLAARGYQLAVEPPHKISKALSDGHRKNDALDSRQIAEYAYRYLDKLHIWKAPQELQEQISVLLATREQYAQQSSAHQSTLLQWQRKVVKTPLAESSLRATIQHLKEQIKIIDQEIKRLISQHPSWGPMLLLLTSIPGVGFLLASNLMVLTQGFTATQDPRRLASHLGLSPSEYESGTSVYRKPRSRGYGHARLRKLLYLAAMSLRTHDPNSQHYFLRKVQEGKSGRLVLNNIANKLIRIICAVARTQKPFIDNYQSVNPVLIHA
jgi:transposase